MSKDVNLLTGIEFENLCQVLLQKAGFDVSTTKQSGDGGIDLVAYSHQAFLSGKYIVQCKRYTGGVGEPIVRDLYGVVMAERANKGILITTGYFSMSAIRFASDKNLELIDGERLTNLLAKYGLIETPTPTKCNHFSQYDCFDTSKFEFYKKMISQNLCTVEMGRDFLFAFMFDYMKKADMSSEINKMLHAGFAEEYLQSFGWYTEKYYKRGKEQLANLPRYINKYKGIAQLLNFDLFEYVYSRYTLLTEKCKILVDYHHEGDYQKDGSRRYQPYKLSDLGDPDSMWYYYEKSPLTVEKLMDENKTVLPTQSYPFYELMNMLSIFSHFHIQNGITLINRLLNIDKSEHKAWIESRDVYQEAITHIHIHYFDINSIVFRKQYLRTEMEYDDFITLDSYFASYESEHQEKIQEEISKIEELLLTLL